MTSLAAFFLPLLFLIIGIARTLATSRKRQRVACYANGADAAGPLTAAAGASGARRYVGSTDSLQKRPPGEPEVRTVVDLWERGRAAAGGRAQCLGERSRSADGVAGEYQWLTYDEVSIRKEGIKKGERSIGADGVAGEYQWLTYDEVSIRKEGK